MEKYLQRSELKNQKEPNSTVIAFIIKA